MKTLIKSLLVTLLIAAFGSLAAFNVGCATAPTERTTQVRTLKAIGETVSTAMQTAAKLRVQGQITERQWQDIGAMHDNRYLPAYRLAVAAVSADLSSAASPDVLAIATELLNAVAAYTSERDANNQKTYMAPDGVNVITELGDGTVISTLAYARYPYSK